jgi:uroporphyrinogen-III synthase
MPNSYPLAGKQFFLTGSAKVQTIAPLIEQNGGDVFTFPLIETQEVIKQNDEIKLLESFSYDWLIFTSQNAVSAYVAKLKRFNKQVTNVKAKIAVVGEKTKEALENHGFTIHFMPTIYSADVFIEQFDGKGKLLFLKGSLAKNTIVHGTGAEQWLVYKTVHAQQHIEPFIEALKQSSNPIVLFASPSAVHAFALHIATKVGWQTVQVASIGHVTTEALAQYGVLPIVQPSTYTMKAVIELLILEETSK